MKIEEMSCQICGLQAVGFNRFGAFCDNREHFITRINTLDEWKLDTSKVVAFEIDKSGKANELNLNDIMSIKH